MRVIKLSPEDMSFPDRSSVYRYFEKDLPERKPPGKFKVTLRKIAKDGLAPGEPLIFSYQAEITHIARASSGRIDNEEGDIDRYPFYFIIDLDSVCLAHGCLAEFETALTNARIYKNIVSAQSWPRVVDTFATIEIWESLVIKPKTGGK